VRPLHLATLLALIGSAIVAVALTGLGAYTLAASNHPWLFSATLLLLGLVSAALVAGAYLRHRKSWAFLMATWVVVGFCAFFAPPKVLDLPKVQPTTMSSTAEVIERENERIKRVVMLICAGFVLPFALLCTGLAIGNRDYQRAA
jgi:cytochrome bd-type quinol oxidase subunit 2